MPKQKTYPQVNEYEQRALNGQPFPYCDTACEHFRRNMYLEPICAATEPETITEYTGKCIGPQRKHVHH